MKKVLVTLIGLFLLVAGFTQETEKEDSGFSIGFAPQYTFMNGFRIDLDFKINDNQNHWLVIAPQFYLKQESNDTYYYNYWYDDNYWGVGTDLLYRIYVAEGSKAKGAYFSPGLTFQYFRIDGEMYQVEPFIDAGTSYFYLVEGKTKSSLFKTGPNILLGYQFNINKKLYVDFYGGIGFRLSFDNRDGDIKRYYNDWWGDIGYSGILLNGGIRAGVVF